MSRKRAHDDAADVSALAMRVSKVTIIDDDDEMHYGREAAQKIELRWKKQLHDGLFAENKLLHQQPLQYALLAADINFTMPNAVSHILQEDILAGILVADPRPALAKEIIVEKLISCYNQKHKDMIAFSINRKLQQNVERARHYKDVVKMVKICTNFRFPLRSDEVSSYSYLKWFKDDRLTHSVVTSFIVDWDKETFVAAIDRQLNDRDICLQTFEGTLTSLVPLSHGLRTFPFQFMFPQFRFFVPKEHYAMAMRRVAVFDYVQLWNLRILKTGQQLPPFIMQMILFYLCRVQDNNPKLTIPSLPYLTKKYQTYYDRHICPPIWTTTSY